MNEGRIYYAEKSGCYYLKFVGTVRVTLCSSLANYINRMFDAQDMKSVLIDLTQAQTVDSTTLGILAKIAMYAHSQGISKPLLRVKDASMMRLVEGMGFDDIFCMVENFPTEDQELQKLKCCAPTCEEGREIVLESHKTLMSMNTKNMSTFSDLVKSLESESVN